MITPAPNIIVAFEREPIEKLFSQGGTSKNLLSEITDNKDVLLFTTKNNPNFISFSHEIAFGGNTVAIKISFIDPKGEFESRYLTTRAIDMIAGYSYREEQGNPTNFGRAARTAQQQTQLKQTLGPAFAEPWIKEFKRVEGKRKIYIAYGIGNNLNTWAGPLTMVMSNVNISFKGAKRLDCTFVPLPNQLSMIDRKGAFNEVANLSLEGLYIETEGRSNKIKFEQLVDIPDLDTLNDLYLGGGAGPRLNVDNDLNSSEFLYTPKGVRSVDDEDQPDYINTFGDDFSTAAKISTLVDFHSIIVDVIRTYVKNATGNSNVIVLLPDLNYICKYAIEQLSSLEGANQKDTLAQTLQESRIAHPDGCVNTAPLDDIVMYYGRDDVLGFTYDTVKRILNNFCLNLDSQLREDYTTPTPRAIGVPGSLKAAIEELPYLDASIANRANITREQRSEYYNNVSSWKRNQARFFFLRDFYASISAGSREGFPNHVATLKKIINQINKSAKGVYSVQWGIFYETNTQVLDYWSSGIFRRHPLFGGEERLNRSEPVIVCGDKSLIKNFLYAAEDLQKLKRQEETLEQLGNTVSTITEEEITDQFNQNLSLIEEEAAFLGNTNQFYVASGAVATAKEKQDLLGESYNYQAFLKIPLHNTDAQILSDQSYNEGLRRILYPPKEELIGAFGGISYIPDEFAEVTEGAYPQEFKDQLVGADIPVFRFNTKNPNILDLKFDFGALYFAFLEQGYSKEISRKASAILAGTINSKYGNFVFPRATDGVGYIINRQRALGGGDASKNQIVRELAAKYQLSDLANNPQEALALAYAAYNIYNTQSNSSIVKVDSLMPGNPLTTTADFAEQLFRSALQMSIKTLPTFHLSNTSVLTTQCLILAQDPPVGNVPKETSLLNTFISGLYKIVGAKHVISGGDAYSQFKLVKNAMDTSSEPTETDRELQLKELTSEGIKELVLQEEEE